MNSAEMQRAFAACLAVDDGGRDGTVLAGSAVQAEQGLAVYRRNLGGVLVRALETAYPACVRVLGERCFRPVARDFVATHPSEGPDLNLYGEGFADFVDGYTAAGQPLQEVPYLGDLARLEWLWQRAAYAPPPIPFPFQAFADAVVQTEGRVRLQPSPGAGWLCSPYPVTAIRALNLGDAHATEVLGLEASVCWCIHATAAGPAVGEIDARARDLLQACARGVELARLPAAVGASEAEVLQGVTALIAHGWIDSFSLATGADRC